MDAGSSLGPILVEPKYNNINGISALKPDYLGRFSGDYAKLHKGPPLPCKSPSIRLILTIATYSLPNFKPLNSEVSVAGELRPTWTQKVRQQIVQNA